MVKKEEILVKLFREEYGNISATLHKLFGLQNHQSVEDIVSNTFLVATEVWGIKGTPEKPRAWLYAVAKNKAKDYIKRKQVYSSKIIHEISIPREIDLEEFEVDNNHIRDSKLQMLFVCCHPSIPKNAQQALALKTLCGFGISEIASAFLTSKIVINKRLLRAKKKWRELNLEVHFPDGKELKNRLNSVHEIIYALFNEGYYSLSNDVTIKKSFCEEATKLCYLLSQHELTNIPATNALLSLFCFHSSRFPSRLDKSGELLIYADQEKKHWDQRLINKGVKYLGVSAFGKQAGRYHFEAGIAFWHTQKDSKEKWDRILELYNKLIQRYYSPITALNRTYAVARSIGFQEAIEEALKINLEEQFLYHVLLAKLYEPTSTDKSMYHLRRCNDVAINQAGKQFAIKSISELLKKVDNKK